MMRQSISQRPCLALCEIAARLSEGEALTRSTPDAGMNLEEAVPPHQLALADIDNLEKEDIDKVTSSLVRPHQAHAPGSHQLALSVSALMFLPLVTPLAARPLPPLVTPLAARPLPPLVTPLAARPLPRRAPSTE
eukprot:363133-Chlamydomonas_euryale.AAC.4